MILIIFATKFRPEEANRVDLRKLKGESKLFRKKVHHATKNYKNCAIWLYELLKGYF